MANEEHLAILNRGVEAWNRWREENPHVRPDLSGADLFNRELQDVNFSGANISQAFLTGTNLFNANLSGANLRKTTLFSAFLFMVDFRGADLRETDLSEANIGGANFRKANMARALVVASNLGEANLSSADLRGVDLSRARLVRTNLSGANLTGSHVYGISAWDLNLEGASQENLVITPPDQPTITVDNLKIAQFIYLLLNNEEIRDVIDTITSKTVLILGRFTEERKQVLDAIRESLRRHNYLPIIFDFDKPASRDLTETVRTLAHMARFIIADLTEPRSIPQELQAIVPDLATPVQPLLLHGSTGEYALFRDLRRKYHWVLATYEYTSQDELLASLDDKVISPAEAKADELRFR